VFPEVKKTGWSGRYPSKFGSGLFIWAKEVKRDRRKFPGACNSVETTTLREIVLLLAAFRG